MQLKMLTLFSSLALVSLGSVASERMVYGVSETAKLTDVELELPAKLDTGAVTASLSAQNIEVFKRDNEEWVRFQLAVEGEKEGKQLEMPVVRTSKIRRRAADIPDGESKPYTARPVVEMEVCLGDTLHNIEVNLTDRTAFSYPLLIGSTALQQFEAAVDPSLEQAAGSPRCAEA